MLAFETIICTILSIFAWECNKLSLFRFAIRFTSEFVLHQKLSTHMLYCIHSVRIVLLFRSSAYVILDDDTHWMRGESGVKYDSIKECITRSNCDSGEWMSGSCISRKKSILLIHFRVCREYFKRFARVATIRKILFFVFKISFIFIFVNGLNPMAPLIPQWTWRYEYVIIIFQWVAIREARCYKRCYWQFVSLIVNTIDEKVVGSTRELFVEKTSKQIAKGTKNSDTFAYDAYGCKWT